jgi:hypothetical protein
MSAAPASGAAPQTTKATSADKTDSTKEVKPAAALEEDDEFEDFPVESTSALCLTRFAKAEEEANVRDGRLDTRRHRSTR